MNEFDILEIAKRCHESNRLYCESLGDYSQKPWDDCPDWQKESAIKGVNFHLSEFKNGNAFDPSASHKSWLEEKVNTGWVYGNVKDADAKTHPCIVDYSELPESQQLKDSIFIGVVCESIGLVNVFSIKKVVVFDKILRSFMDSNLQILKSLKPSRERSLSITKSQEAIMWLGMDLKRLNEPNPYPDSYNSSNTNIEPTADNLKL